MAVLPPALGVLGSVGLVGLGFNWFEVALYVAQGYAETGVAPYGSQLGGRYALFGLAGHAMFTGIFGASLGLAIQTRRRWIRILAPIAGLVLAVAAHMLNNALPLLVTLAGAAEETDDAHHGLIEITDQGALGVGEGKAHVDDEHCRALPESDSAAEAFCRRCAHSADRMAAPFTLLFLAPRET